MNVLILLAMIFLHIVDDYYLQGILAKLKQKSWWEENAPDLLYKNDYIIALIEHAFSWSFMIMLPIMIKMMYTKEVNYWLYISCFLVNLIIHAFVDHAKANKRSINLVTDQLIHIVQVIITWFISCI